VRRANGTHLALSLESLQQRELRGDVDQVVNLIDVDVTVQPKGVLRLLATFIRV